MAIPRIDYQSLASQRWRRFESDGSPSNAGGVVSEDGYLEEFVDVTQFISEGAVSTIDAEIVMRGFLMRRHFLDQRNGKW